MVNWRSGVLWKWPYHHHLVLKSNLPKTISHFTVHQVKLSVTDSTPLSFILLIFSTSSFPSCESFVLMSYVLVEMAKCLSPFASCSFCVPSDFDLVSRTPWARHHVARSSRISEIYLGAKSRMSGARSWKGNDLITWQCNVRCCKWLHRRIWALSEKVGIRGKPALRTFTIPSLLL